MLEKYKLELKKKSEVYLQIKVHPGASKNEVREILADDTIKISITKAAQENKANEELIKFLAKELGVNRAGVRIISGAASKLKLVKIKIWAE